MGSVRCLALSPDGRTLFTGGEDGKAKAWDLGDPGDAPIREFEHGRSVSCLALSADGRTLFTGGWDGKVKAWNLARGSEGELPASFPFCASAHCMAMTGDVLVLGATGGSIQVLDVFPDRFAPRSRTGQL